MKTKKTLALLAACGLTATAAYSQNETTEENWQAGFGLMRFSEDFIDLDAAFASIGYRVKTSDNFYIIPEFRFGTGLGKDEGIEVDTFYSLGAKAQFEFESGFYAFGSVSWGDLKVKSDWASASDDQVGFGIGAGYDFNEKLGAELSWEDFDGTSLYQVGLKVKF